MKNFLIFRFAVADPHQIQILIYLCIFRFCFKINHFTCLFAVYLIKYTVCNALKLSSIFDTKIKI